MSLTDIPEDVIILICQFMKPIQDYFYSYEKNSYVYDRMIHIYKLIRTCKSFGYLKNYSFLMYHTYGEYDDIFCSVNYLGVYNGPQYWRICGQWSGYKDNENDLYTVMEASNYGYHIVHAKKYEFADLNFEDMINDIYEKKFHDKEIIDYVGAWPKVNYTIIRKSFPVINISQKELNGYLKKHKSK